MGRYFFCRQNLWEPGRIFRDPTSFIVVIIIEHQEYVSYSEELVHDFRNFCNVPVKASFGESMWSVMCDSKILNQMSCPLPVLIVKTYIEHFRSRNYRERISEPTFSICSFFSEVQDVKPKAFILRTGKGVVRWRRPHPWCVALCVCLREGFSEEDFPPGPCGWYLSETFNERRQWSASTCGVRILLRKELNPVNIKRARRNKRYTIETTLFKDGWRIYESRRSLRAVLLIEPQEWKRPQIIMGRSWGVWDQTGGLHTITHHTQQQGAVRSSLPAQA